MNANALDELIPSDLITIKEAGRLANNAHRSTILRWILKGKLVAYRRAGHTRFVSRAAVLSLIQPERQAKPERPPTRREKTAREKWTDEVLAKFGM